jgi:CRP-like cAMP-binding protein/tetratricopeptide (TPR) repeat protein
VTDLPQDLESLIQLAKRLAGRRRYEEASELLAVALRMDPANRGAKLALAEVRKRQGQAAGASPKSPRDTLLEQQRRGAIDAAHFIGLAHLYAEKGENARALDCLQVAEARHSTSPSHHKLRGRILFRRKDFERASQALAQALRLNPFDRETAETLGRSEYECGRFEEAVRITTHAFLLLHEGDQEGAVRVRRRIRTFKQILGWGSRDLTRVFRERQEHLHVAYDRLEWHKERFLEEAGLPGEGLWHSDAQRPGRVGQIEQAARLRRLPLWSQMSDGQIFRLTEAAREEDHDFGSQLFAHGSRSRDLYLVESGEVTIQRPTPYGTFTLAKLGPGSLLGELSFLSGTDRSGDAVVSRPTRLLRLDAERLDRMMDDDPDLGAQLLWSFWHALVSKLRDTNEQLRSFFSADAQSENFLRLRRPTIPGEAQIQQVKVDSSDKIRLFREQGLTGRELSTLATFSREKRFAENAYVFQEGEEGTEMYIVLEGRARISKFIPGGGEEALAFLERGEFFGEMSLVDGAPRSADARAHGGPLTVLAIDEATLQEILSMDAAASSEFLRLLCRLVTHRLREIDEKVIGWRILSGDREGGASA